MVICMSKKIKNNYTKLYSNSGSSSDDDEMIRLMKVLGVVVVILLLFYLVFAIYNGEISFSKKKTEKEEVEVQNTEILAGSIFSRNKDEYYVLFYDFDGNNAIKCDTIYSVYTQLNSASSKMYIVDLGNAFNKKYATTSIDEVNVSGVSSLKVVDATLIKVSNGVGTIIASGIDALNNYQSTLLG